MTEKIRVLIADDHWLLRQSLRSVLQSFDEIDIVGEAENGQVAIDKLEALKPDIVLMDIRMPVLDGIEATRRIAAKATTTKIIALSSYSDQHYVNEMVQAGASGYLDKTAGARNLVHAITSIHYGRPDDSNKNRPEGA